MHLGILRHDPHELVAASPQIHLVDDAFHLAAVVCRGRNDEVESVGLLDSHVDPQTVRNRHPEACQRGGRVVGDGGVGPCQLRERLLELDRVALFVVLFGCHGRSVPSF